MDFAEVFAVGAGVLSRALGGGSLASGVRGEERERSANVDVLIGEVVC